jgi:hypothetical protein
MEKYNGWTILEILDRRNDYRKFVRCQCICGKICEKELRFIVSGKIKSCSHKCALDLKRPEFSEELVIEKYKEFKTVKDTARFFMRGDTSISKILKDNNVKLYEGRRKDPEVVRKQLVNKVLNYRKRRLKRDPLYKSILRIRSLIGQIFIRMNYTKKSICTEILGIDWKGFQLHIESKFKEGMTWENYGEWEYDHIIPVSFAKNEEEVIKLNHYSNFQPLWKEENKIKSNKVL